jgi:hypothetical protein
MRAKGPYEYEVCQGTEHSRMKEQMLLRMNEQMLSCMNEWKNN